jgi:hypothetical protein
MDMPVSTSYVPKGDGGYDFWFEGKQVSLKDYITEIANMYGMTITDVEKSAWMPPGSSVAEDAGTGVVFGRSTNYCRCSDDGW